MRGNAEVRNEHPVCGRTETTADVAVCNLTELLKAEQRCHRGVGYKNSVARYHMLRLSKTYATLIELESGTYHTQKGDNFVIHEPKYRVVTSTKYKDRIPQASFVVNRYYPLVASNLIDNNFACLKGKGVDRAREALADILRESSIEEYALKVDFKDYFGSIDHRKLVEELGEHIQDEWDRWFLRDIFGSNGSDIGITLGSEPNQLCAVAFLNPLDHMLSAGRYVRYMDDLVYIGSKDRVLAAYRVIQEEAARLGLNISKKKTYIQSLKNPVSFLGFTFLLHPTGRVTMKRKTDKLNNEKRKLRRMKNKGIPFAAVEEHYRCVRSVMKKGSRSGVVKLDRYFNRLFEEEIKNGNR